MWEPTSEEELQRAITSSDFRESHTLEYKREVGDTRGDRTETARDLASLAVDGGVLIIGVEEDKGARTYSLTPFSLQGVVESLEQIAELRIDPPLTIHPVEIPAAAGPSNGYVAITVPPSPAAPHMVDGAYYGRGEMRRQKLSDAEVVRHQSARRAAGVLADAPLDALIAADPISADETRNGHLYLVAVPVTGAAGLAEDLAWNRDQVREVMMVGDSGAPEQLLDGSLAFSLLRFPVRGEQGFGWSSVDRRAEKIDETWAIDFGVTEDGTLTLFTGGLTQAWTPRGKTTEQRVVADGQLVAAVYQFLSCVTEIADRVGYAGAWDIGIAGTGMRDAASEAVETGDQVRLPLERVAFPADAFRNRARATRRELDTDRSAIVRRLVGRVLRGLGSPDWLLAHVK